MKCGEITAFVNNFEGALSQNYIWLSYFSYGSYNFPKKTSCLEKFKIQKIRVFPSFYDVNTNTAEKSISLS